MQKHTHTHSLTHKRPWWFFSTVWSSVEQRQKALPSCDEKYFKFKENFICKHLQTYSLSLLISSSLYPSHTLSVCFMVDAFIASSLLYREFAMRSSLDPCGDSALLPPQAGQKSEVALIYRAATTWSWYKLSALLDGPSAGLMVQEEEAGFGLLSVRDIF